MLFKQILDNFHMTPHGSPMQRSILTLHSLNSFRIQMVSGKGCCRYSHAAAAASNHVMHMYWTMQWGMTCVRGTNASRLAKTGMCTLQGCVHHSAMLSPAVDITLMRNHLTDTSICSTACLICNRTGHCLPDPGNSHQLLVL